MDSDALLLARIQFGFTISFHIIFPAITIGLASYLAVLEGLWLRTRATVYRDLYHFWTKIFAVNFGMGVVSGLVMAYQFGTNWSFFSDFAGSITGPLLAYEVLTAFFLEAGFLGVMLFGWSRVGPGLHFFHGDGGAGHAGVGNLDPGVQQLDADASRLRDRQRPGRAHGLAGGDLQSVLPYRLAHMGIAAFLATALMVGASGAWHLLRGDRSPAVKKMFTMAMGMLLLVAPLQAVVGDFHGLNTLKHQPAKVAAMEGHWENEPGAGVPLTLFGLPDMEKEETRHALNIPRLGSLILTHSWDGQFPGLKSYPAADRPNVPVVFWSFRIMVGLGLLMIALAIWALWTRWRGRLYESRALQRFALWMGPSGLIAMLAGWYVTEVGRQPWVVYGVMRTADAATPHGLGELTLTLALFVVVYLLVFGAGVSYMLRLIRMGPTPAPATPHCPADPANRASRRAPVRRLHRRRPAAANLAFRSLRWASTSH